MRARHRAEQQDQHRQTQHGRDAVLQELQTRVAGRQPLRGDPGPDDDGHQQTRAEELGQQASEHHGAILTAQDSSVKIEPMNVERTELELRAAKHAALSDPARLHIVDLLSLGDLSPSELQERLGMPSNLLAHHLKTLEAAGFLARGRSEADRRRSYVRLTPGALDGLAPGAVGHAHRVVFVCTANSARSQLAAALWRRTSDIPVASAGTHPADRVDPGAVAAARRHRLPLRASRPRRLADIAADGDFVVTVCDHAHEELGDLGGLHWSIPDPVRVGTDDAFDTTVTALADRVDDLAPRLSAS